MATPNPSQARVLDLIRRIRTGYDRGIANESALDELRLQVDYPDPGGLCRSDYSEETILGILLGWKEAHRDLSRSELVELIQQIRSGPAETEPEGIVMVEAFKHNCRHPAKSDLLFFPVEHFGRPDPSSEEIVAKALLEVPLEATDQLAESTDMSSAESVKPSVLCDLIESPGFAEAATRASCSHGRFNLKRFVAFLIGRSEVRGLSGGPADTKQRVLQRLCGIVNRACTEEAWDTAGIASATYLWILGSYDPGLAVESGSALKSLSNVHVARQMVEYWARFASE